MVSFCSDLNFYNRPFHARSCGEDPRCSLVEPNAEILGSQARTHLSGLSALPPSSPHLLLSGGQKVSALRPPGLNDGRVPRRVRAHGDLESAVVGWRPRGSVPRSSRGACFQRGQESHTASGSAEVLGTRRTPALEAYRGPLGFQSVTEQSSRYHSRGPSAPRRLAARSVSAKTLRCLREL